MKKAILLVVILLSFAFPSFAQENDYSAPTKQEQFEAEVIKIDVQEKRRSLGIEHTFQKLSIEVITGKYKGEKMKASANELPTTNMHLYRVGDKVLVAKISGVAGEQIMILDYQRRDGIMMLTLIFIILTLLIGRLRGLASLIGLVYTFLIIFYFLLPRILAGDSPVLTALVSGALIVPVTFYLSHGINRKTHMAIVSTIIALILTGVVSIFFVDAAHLTGMADENVGFLQLSADKILNAKGLLYAGIIIALLGILDDITVSQAAIVEKLQKNSPSASRAKIFSEAMDVGRDHIASLVNTLILVYAGAALPFLLLFIVTDQSVAQALNYEVVAEEIVRTLIASIGLILAVPITTILASLSKK